MSDHFSIKLATGEITVATDIKQVMLQSQDVIDAAGTLVEETKKTQIAYRDGLTHTDDVMGYHNDSGMAHPDIREQMKDMPKMISDPVVTGPSSTETGVEGEWKLSAVAMIPTAKIIKFIVTDNNNVTVEVPVESDGRATLRHAFTGERNENVEFTVRARGEHSFESNDVKHPLLITKHLPPNFSKMEHTIPKVISYGKTYEFSISGVYDEDEDLATINLVCDDPKIQFSQKENLIQGQKYSFTVDSDYKGPATISFIIRADDDWGLHTTFPVPVHLNADPNSSTIVHNIPTYLTANTVNDVRVQNVLDPDGDDVTFDIVSSNANIVPSKLKDIALNEDFTIRVGELTPGTPYTLTLNFKDPHGGTASTTITSKINVPPSASALTMTPDKEYYKAGEAGYVVFTGATDTENQELTVTITPVTGEQDVIWSKTERVPLNEQIPFTIADRPHRGQIAFTLTVYDASGGTDSVVKTLRINNVPTIESMTTTIPPVVIPGSRGEYTVRGAIDPDGSPVTYDILSNNPNVIITNGVGISAETLFTLQVPTEDQVPRGSTFPVTVRATDGVEVAETTLNIRQNKIVDISGMIVDGIPARIIPKADYKVNITGAVDEDGTYTYSIISDAPDELVFSKRTGITEGEEINLDTTRAVRGKTYTLTIRATDDIGEYQEKTITTRMNKDIQIKLGHNIPAIVMPGKTYDDITFTGITDEDADDTIQVTVEATGGVQFTRTSGDGGPDSVYSLSIPSAELLPRGTVVTATITATDSYEERTAEVTFSVNQLPIAAASTYTVALVAKPNTVYDWRFDAVTDLDVTQKLEYSVACDNPAVVISDQVSSETGVTFKAAIPAEEVIPRGETISFILTVSDGLEKATKTILTRINTPPKVEPVSIGEIPVTVFGGAEHAWEFTLSGATDIDTSHDVTHTHTYSIINDDPNVSFSKIIGILENEPVTATFKKVTVDTPVSFNIQVVDALGDKSDLKLIETTIKPIIVTVAPEITAPKQGAEIDDTEGWTMEWTGYSSMIWTGEGPYPNN